MNQLDVHDPSTGELVDSLTFSDPDELVRRSKAATGEWTRTDAAARASALKAGAQLVREAKEEIALQQTREGGKPLDDSRGGVDAGIGAIEQYAELGPLHRGRTLQGGWNSNDWMTHVSRGVAVLCLPWNDPVAIACAQIGANLAVGNTVICKPSEKTPLSTAAVIDLLQQNLPADVLQLAVGDGFLGADLVAHPQTDVVVHIGSAETGRKVATTCATKGIKALLELGGKDPMIVDAGVDPKWAASQADIGCFANVGQICQSIERIYVHREVAEPFLTELVQRAKAKTVGPGTDPQTEMGPLIDQRQLDIVDSHVQQAVSDGAQLLCGGHRLEGPGYFYTPTVIEGVKAGMTLVEQETFGPVAAVEIVDSFEEALAAANRTDYGLAAAVLTPDLTHAQRATRELQVGTVKINSVFGGAPGGAASPHGSSGSGFGYGPELLDELTRVRVIHLEPAPATG